VRLAQLLDMSVVQRLAEASYTANGMPVGIIDAHDGSILVGCGWQDICVHFHRAHERSRARCQKSDEFIRDHLSEVAPCEYTCENGLRDIGVPILVAGEHLATLFLGQFFYEGESLDREFFVRQAREFGYDEAAYLAALDRIPVFGRRSVENILAFNRALARFIAELAEGTLRERTAQEDLRETERRLTLAMRASKTSFFDWDLEAGVLRHDPRFFTWPQVPVLIRGTLEEIADVLAAPEDRALVSEGLQGALDGRQDLYSIEHRRPAAGGRVAWVRARGMVVERDAAGRARRLCGTVTDVTERRELQERAISAERMASLGTLAGGIAHEINNPLSYVLSNLRFLSESLAALGPSPGRLAEARDVVDETLQGAERIRQIVQDLLAFARPNREMKPVDLQRVLDLALSLASSEIRFRARMVKDYQAVPAVFGDEYRLGQVALNLLINAAHAIPAGRPDRNRIRVSTRTDPSGRAVLEVEDTGDGIPAEIRSRVFEPFFTTKPVGVGTGLGLSICHGIVTSLGGEITVESEVGKGTAFRVLLPAVGGASRAGGA
jgi:signal transduction histidine kinase